MSLRLLWRPVLKLFLGLGLGMALGGMFWACAQGEGERCERDQDCQADLRCDRSSGAIEGTCTSGRSPTPSPDAMEPPIQPPDSGVDMPLQPDAPADMTPATPDTGSAERAPDTSGG